MTRGTWVYRNGKLVPKHKAAPKHSGCVYGVISDSLPDQLEHHGYQDGRKTDSKSVFRRWTKEAGLVEKGNDRESARPVKAPDLRSDVAQAINMLKNGYRPQYRQIRGD